MDDAAVKVHLEEAANKIGFTIPDAHVDEYETLFKSMAESCELIMGMPDYQPAPAPYPRDNVHWPTKEENPLGGWTWKADVAGAPEGILKGKTVCLKDNICLAGVPLLMGTTTITDYIPVTDATVAKRVLDAGAIIKGKATCEAWSASPDSFSATTGPVHNPFAKGFSAGGSSSGCGALVGSGAVDMGIGGDQGGSVRIPASLCGHVGMKATKGLIPYTGAITSDWGADHLGPMTQTVEDCALLLEAIAGYDNIDDRQLGAPNPGQVPKYRADLLEARKAGIKGLRVGVLSEGYVNPNLDPRVKELVDKACEGLVALGATLVPVSAPLHLLSAHLNKVVNRLGTCQTRMGRQVGNRGLGLTDFYEKLLPWNQEKIEKAGVYVADGFLEGEFAWKNYPTAFHKANNILRQLRDQYDALLEEVDVLVMPTVMQPARRFGKPNSGPLSWSTTSPGIISNTASFNLTNHPAITIPVGKTSPVAADIREPGDEKIRLPVGLQIVAKRFDEAGIMRVADAWEQAYNWREIEVV